MGFWSPAAEGESPPSEDHPLVGDKVIFTPLDNGAGILDEILPRRNEFQRPAVANIDQLVVIASGAIPVTDPFLIDRVVSIGGRGGTASRSSASTSATWMRRRSSTRPTALPGSPPSG